MNYEVMSLQHTLDIKQAPYDQHSQKKLDPAAKPEAERDRQSLCCQCVIEAKHEDQTDDEPQELI